MDGKLREDVIVAPVAPVAIGGGGAALAGVAYLDEPG